MQLEEENKSYQRKMELLENELEQAEDQLSQFKSRATTAEEQRDEMERFVIIFISSMCHLFLNSLLECCRMHPSVSRNNGVANSCFSD